MRKATDEAPRSVSASIESARQESQLLRAKLTQRWPRSVRNSATNCRCARRRRSSR